MGGRLGGSTKSNSITSMFKKKFDPPSPLRILAQNFLCEMAFRDPAGQLNMLNNARLSRSLEKCWYTSIHL